MSRDNPQTRAPTTGRAGAAHGLKVRAGGCSRAGENGPNQDAFAVSLPRRQQVLLHKGVVAAIADGVSVSGVSDRAAELAVNEFIGQYLETPPTWSVNHAAEKVLRSLNQWLYQHALQYSSRQGQLTQADSAMACAFAGVVIKSNTAYIFSVGDCRVWLYRQGQLQQLTRDHRCFAGDRYQLTRALGIDSHLQLDCQAVPLQHGDRLLLSSDGIHDSLSQTQLQHLMDGPSNTEGQNNTGSSAPSRDPLELIADAMVAQASAQTQQEKKAKQDDMSGVILAIDSLPTPNLNEFTQFMGKRLIPKPMKPGQQLDHYDIVQTLYDGSRSHLYLVHSQLDGKSYVLKAPSLNFADDPTYISAFLKEGWLGVQLNSPYIINLHPPSQHSGYLYHISDRVGGCSARQWLLDNPKASLSNIRIVARGAIRALRALQRMSVLHRDIKPDNFMVDSNLSVTLIDLGSATAPGLEELNVNKEDYPLGDLNYLAPECLQGQTASLQSEIYALAVTLYELLTGHLPYKPVNPSRPTPPGRHEYIPASHWRSDVPDWMDAALRKACHPTPNQRYSALSEFDQDLNAPNPQLIKQQKRLPLLEQNPLRFWKAVSAILLLTSLTLAMLLIGKS
ncbi:bifunctional protein-serine/threonine kinase/phosphatase [Shewanella submarina]|uniref:Protein phosphatase 2C domain-containing protein n=1 Tax=Shewanella submarina TaxID=2016376 RepID=A0ABV7GJ29_9GAMM|nr:bifunctional protein-serine/threonine kinase/phosphatase [Shewanella submarina]MCL1035959.1 bifunctional protein-serine/threonine kinase/phosphatase [Shewanella submarina]